MPRKGKPPRIVKLSDGSTWTLEPRKDFDPWPWTRKYTPGSRYVFPSRKDGLPLTTVDIKKIRSLAEVPRSRVGGGAHE